MALVCTGSTSAEAMAQALVAPNTGITLVPGSASTIGIITQMGTFTGGKYAADESADDNGIPFANGLVFSSGLISAIPGPNISANTGTNLHPAGGGATVGNPAFGDADMNAYLLNVMAPLGLNGRRGTFDATGLVFNFISAGPTVTLSYVWASEEYNEFVGATFVDFPMIILNGVNIALVGGLPICCNSVNAAEFPEYFIDNDSGYLDIAFDGIVLDYYNALPLVATATITPGAVNTLKICNADVSDAVLDSALFIKLQSLTSNVTAGTPAGHSVSLSAGTTPADAAACADVIPLG